MGKPTYCGATVAAGGSQRGSQHGSPSGSAERTHSPEDRYDAADGRRRGRRGCEGGGRGGRGIVSDCMYSQ